ncbi:MAG: TRAP transporter substrate-binding protein [Burkholderiales bacterium]
MRKMSNVKGWRVALIAGCIAASMPGPVLSQEVKMNLADAYAPTEFMNVNMLKWADEIRAATNGSVQITMHFSGSLYKNPDIKRAVQTGQVELGTQLMQNLGPEKRVFEVDGLPFLVRSYDEGMKLWEASRSHIDGYMQKQGLRLLYAVPWPSQGFFFKKEVNSLADVAGLRQRAYNEMTSRLARLMNTVPTTVQITELPQAMTTGTVQMFNTSPTTGVVFKVWEYTSHFYDTDAWLPKQMVFINETAFKKLSAGAQKAMLDASTIAEKRGWDLSRENVDTARKKLAEMGIKIVKPSSAFQAELNQIGETMRAEWLQKADDESKAAISQFLKAVGR